MGDEIIYIVILLVYLAGMLVIGFISSKKVTNSKSYYTSDRNVSAAVTGFSYSSTQLSSGSTIGMPATVYTQGYSYMGTPMAAAAAPWFTFLLTGERVRKISERVDAIDYGDIFRARFGNASKILYELLIIVFAIPTIISQFAAAGKDVKKKSLTEIAMSYGYVYVAQVAMGANPAQTIKAITEAEAYHGPSLIIGYSPCEMHSIKGGMMNCQKEMKRAVDCGYWNLFRFNPAAPVGQRFSMDSKAPAGGYQEFLMNEARYSRLTREFPARADRLFKESEDNAKARYEHLMKLKALYE